tara:strand:- start:74004 stop:74297 length:294 start_codon:yes stop_codon:yes gene_type:complete
MYTIDTRIKDQSFNALQVQKLVKTDHIEILSISLEKGAVFPKHTSATDAELVVLQGCIVFHINKKDFELSTQEHFSFPKEVAHWVEATEDSKFLIIR